MKLLKFINLFSAFAIFLISISANALVCNGSSQLCAKRYNECTYLTTHNAQSNRKNFLFSFLPGSNISNQSLSIFKQLKLGVRGMKMPVYDYDGNTYVCHGMKASVKAIIKEQLCNRLWFLHHKCGEIVDNMNPCEFDPATQTLVHALTKIEKFLRTHPDEVVTLFLEDYTISFSKLMSAFNDAKLVEYLHGQNQTEEWPTLEKMIQNNKRLVVFINRDKDGEDQSLSQYPLFNSRTYFAWGTQFTFRTIDKLKSDHPDHIVKSQPAFREWDQSPQNKLWYMQHFITPTLGGAADSAAIVNRAEFLRTRLKKYNDSGLGNPNFIWIDFVELPRGSPGISEVIQELNNPPAKLVGPTENKLFSEDSQIL